MFSFYTLTVHIQGVLAPTGALIVTVVYLTPRIALFVGSLVRPLVTKFQPPGVLDASGVLDAA